MGKKNKHPHFQLDPNWIVSEPIDFEYKQYQLLGYLQKCNENFENHKIYPDFIELSLHLANIQSLLKEETYFETTKDFINPDDEILLKELKPKRTRNLVNNPEIEKILKFSGPQLFEMFQLGKSIWSIVYESASVNLKRNKGTLNLGKGFAAYKEESSDNVYVWFYKLDNEIDGKTTFDLIYSGGSHLKFTEIINTFSEIEETEKKYLPVFELLTTQEFPFQESLIPIFKRKVSNYVQQTVKFTRSIENRPS
jgi:hypothetical protein